MFGQIPERFVHVWRIVFPEFEDRGFQIVWYNQTGHPIQKLKGPTNGPTDVRRRWGPSGLRIQIPRGLQYGNEQLHLARLVGVGIHHTRLFAGLICKQAFLRLVRQAHLRIHVSAPPASIELAIMTVLVPRRVGLDIFRPELKQRRGPVGGQLLMRLRPNRGWARGRSPMSRDGIEQRLQLRIRYRIEQRPGHLRDPGSSWNPEYAATTHAYTPGDRANRQVRNKYVILKIPSPFASARVWLACFLAIWIRNSEEDNSDREIENQSLMRAHTPSQSHKSPAYKVSQFRRRIRVLCKVSKYGLSLCRIIYPSSPTRRVTRPIK